jgi:hypothetical protein
VVLVGVVGGLLPVGSGVGLLVVGTGVAVLPVGTGVAVLLVDVHRATGPGVLGQLSGPQQMKVVPAAL